MAQADLMDMDIDKAFHDIMQTLEFTENGNLDKECMMTNYVGRAEHVVLLMELEQEVVKEVGKRFALEFGDEAIFTVSLKDQDGETGFFELVELYGNHNPKYL